VAGILLQKSDEGLFKPVSYFSRKTTPDEQRLHSFELETLAVVASLSRFRVYLLGVPFKILTDCNALRTTLTKRDLIPRISRWWIQLTEFDCEIEYRPGTGMTHVDALSRNPVDMANVENHVLDVFTNEVEDWISTVQSSDDEVSRIKRILSDPEFETVVDVRKNYRLKSGKVYRVLGDGINEGMRWVVPKGVRWQVTKMNHDDIGHFGFDKTLHRIQQSFWFPKMRRFIKKYVRACIECAHHKDSGKRPGQLHPIEKIEIPFHTIHADHLGPFVRSKRGNIYILVIICGFTKFINITAVKNTKSSTTIRVFREHFGHFGAPVRLITDQGTSFTSNSFRSFAKSHGIKHILNAVATPRANGQVERFNRTILDALSTKCHGQDDKSWDEYIPDIQIGINTTIHKTTGKSPSELLFGYRLKSRTENVLSEVIDETLEIVRPENIEEVRREAGERIRIQQTKDKSQYDKKRTKKRVLFGR
jgi:transposase InsO family protein